MHTSCRCCVCMRVGVGVCVCVSASVSALKEAVTTCIQAAGACVCVWVCVYGACCFERYDVPHVIKLLCWCKMCEAEGKAMPVMCRGTIVCN